jgi:two-component system phosphate regulon sensor histidine kinase PhoR
MNKKLFILLIALMSLSLLGIIFVQGYWISNSYRDKEEQVNYNFRQVLNEVARDVQVREIEDYYRIYSGLADSVKTPESINFSELVYTTQSDKSNETYIFSDGILEEDYKLSSSFLDTEIDSILFRRIINKKSTTKVISGLDGSGEVSQTIETFSRLKDYERSRFENAFKNISSRTPIHKRVSVDEIENSLLEAMEKRGLKSDVEFAVYSNGLSTRVHSRNFAYDPEKILATPLFVNEELKIGYDLLVYFSEKKKTALKSIMGMAILSLIFTSVIVLAYSSAISQIFKQRQISQIKSDFINNMTHEFKTPIATINLALDALKNPKAKGNEEFVDRYLEMIRDENRRMHAQVENVLRISKLEKNQLDLPKDRIKLHDLIQNAVSHVNLIVEDRNGYIKTHLGALRSSVFASESHLTNVVINIMDNAIKYSEDEPKIDIYTENVKDSIILKIRDQGIGMTKAVQKKIFEKFYRESTGDIHNVKGHGLGLAYAKRILDDHDAEIYVDSEKGKGSTFTIKLHLIS